MEQGEIMILILEDHSDFISAAERAGRILGKDVIVINNIYEAKIFIEENHERIEGLIADGNIETGGENYQLAPIRGVQAVIGKIVEAARDRYESVLSLIGSAEVEYRNGKMSAMEEMTEHNFGQYALTDGERYVHGDTSEIISMARKYDIPFRVFTNFHSSDCLIFNVLDGNIIAEVAGEANINHLCLSNLLENGDVESFNLLKRNVNEEMFIFPDYQDHKNKTTDCYKRAIRSFEKK